MRRIWRAVLALLLVVGPALWMPALGEAATDIALSETTVQGPAAGINNNDPDELCRSGNPRKQKKCKYNGWDNDNRASGNDSRILATSPDGLVVELWRSNEWPERNKPLTLAVKGDASPIAQVAWRATGPTSDDPDGGDMAHLGEQTYDCSGAVPCAYAWTVTPRYDGHYTVYARVRDTFGGEAELTWTFTSD